MILELLFDKIRNLDKSASSLNITIRLTQRLREEQQVSDVFVSGVDAETHLFRTLGARAIENSGELEPNLPVSVPRDGVCGESFLTERACIQTFKRSVLLYTDFFHIEMGKDFDTVVT
jgi:hypothetical protein